MPCTRSIIWRNNNYRNMNTVHNEFVRTKNTLTTDHLSTYRESSFPNNLVYISN